MVFATRAKAVPVALWTVHLVALKFVTMEWTMTVMDRSIALIQNAWRILAAPVLTPKTVRTESITMEIALSTVMIQIARRIRTASYLVCYSMTHATPMPIVVRTNAGARQAARHAASVSLVSYDPAAS
jgi:hypothetical protein